MPRGLSRASLSVFIVFTLLLAQATAQDCNTIVSQSPRGGYAEEPLVAVAGGFLPKPVYDAIKFSLFAGYPLWFYGGFTNFASFTVEPGLNPNLTRLENSEYIVVSTVYENGSFRLGEYGSYEAFSGKIYWGPASEGVLVIASNASQGYAVSLHAFGYELVTQDTSVGGIESPGVAPLLALLLFNESGLVEDYYVAGAVVATPSIARVWLDNVTSQGGAVNEIRYQVYPIDENLYANGASGYFNVVFAEEMLINYTLGGEVRYETYTTVLLVHGKFNLTEGGFNVNSAVYALDLTSRDQYLVRDVQVFGILIDQNVYTGSRSLTGARVGWYILNSTNTSQVIYDGRLSPSTALLVIGDWLVAANTSGHYLLNPAVYDAIEDRQLGNAADYMDLVVEQGGLYFVVQPADGPPMVFEINRTYVNNVLEQNGLTGGGRVVASVLPVFWLTEASGNYTLNKEGVILLVNGLVRGDNNTYLLVVPYYFGDADPTSLPQPYKRLLNGGQPYLVDLTGTAFSRIDWLAISSWHIVGFVRDPSGLFGGSNDSVYAPLLAASIIYETENGPGGYLSLDLPAVLTRAQIANTTWMDPGRVLVYKRGGPVVQNQIDDIIINYTLGGRQAARLEDLPSLGAWLTSRLHKLQGVVEVNASLTATPLGGPMGALPPIFAFTGTPYYPNPTGNPAVIPSTNYTLSFNSITGVPVLALTVFNAQGQEMPVVYVANVTEGPDPGFLYPSGLSFSVIGYTVSARFLAISGEPTILAPPALTPGALLPGRYGFEYAGVFAVGAIADMYVDKAISSYGDAGDYAPGQCDVYDPPACFNLTTAPGTVLFVVDGQALLEPVFVLDTTGVAGSVTAYYYDPNTKGLLSKVVCDGDCQSLQSSDPCGVLRIPRSDTSLSPENVLVAVAVNYTAQPPGENATTATTMPGGGGVQPPPAFTVSLPEGGVVSRPSLSTPKGLMTVLLFLAFYVFYNQRMTHAQALATSAALAGVASILLWGEQYLAAVVIVFGVGIALYYVLGK